MQASIGITEGNGGGDVSEGNGITLRTRNKLPLDRYRETLDLAEKGDRSALPQVRELLDEFPSMVDELGDLTQIAQGLMLSRFGDSVLIHEAQERKLLALTEQIAGPDASALEKLLANQIVLCWQHVRFVEINYAQARDYTSRAGDYYERCIDRAQRRYLAAIKTLAQVRKLGLPAMQVNIAADGGKQVNVSG